MIYPILIYFWNTGLDFPSKPVSKRIESSTFHLNYLQMVYPKSQSQVTIKGWPDNVILPHIYLVSAIPCPSCVYECVFDEQSVNCSCVPGWTGALCDVGEFYLVKWWMINSINSIAQQMHHFRPSNIWQLVIYNADVHINYNALVPLIGC